MDQVHFSEGSSERSSGGSGEGLTGPSTGPLTGPLTNAAIIEFQSHFEGSLYLVKKPGSNTSNITIPTLQAR